MARRHDPGSIEKRVFAGLQRLIQVRKGCGAFAGNDMHPVDTGSEHVLGYVRQHENQRALVLANFSEQPQNIAGNLLRLHGLSYSFTDLVSGRRLSAQDLQLDAYSFLCLAPDPI